MHQESMPKDASIPPLVTRTPRLSGDDPLEMRRRIRDYFLDTWTRYESLFECLNCDDAYLKKSISLRHPLIFYLGHTATFFVNKLMLTRLLNERVDEEFESVFAVGVDEMSWDDLDESNYNWPTVAQVMEYRNKVRNRVLGIIESAPLSLPIYQESPWWAIVMGIEHERIHLETSSVLIRQQKIEWVSPHPDWARCEDFGPAPTNKLLPVEGGRVVLGKDADSDIYGWDNEYGSHEADVAGFEASQYLVSNQEFLEFVEAGGYQNEAYWSEEGWQWLDFSKREAPEFWRKGASESTGEWALRLMTEEVPMPWNWPVETNFLEAEAFCNWKAEQTGEPIRLPTEDEWYRLYDVADVQVRPDTPWNASLHLDHHASSCPVDRFKHGEFYDVIGNVWQWTQTPIYPFEGFEVHPIYDDFSVPTFDGKHNLMKGGSWISCGNETEPSSRYAFRRHFFQHAGFRYVRGELKRTAPTSLYETDELMSEYAEFHYGDSYFGVPNFPRALVELLAPYLEGRETRKALDLGCASGRASFELARYFDEVLGLDFSVRFIDQGVQIGRDGMLRYTLTDEGDLRLFKTRTLAELGLDKVRVPDFAQGDACNLKPNYRDFDLVFAANLIDRLYEPAKFLNDIHTRIQPGGLLMIASPYTWLEEHTPRDKWIGGFKKNGENVTTLDGLKAHLEPNFRLLDAPRQVPFVIRETSHKFQHSLSEMTVWERHDD